MGPRLAADALRRLVSGAATGCSRPSPAGAVPVRADAVPDRGPAAHRGHRLPGSAVDAGAGRMEHHASARRNLTQAILVEILLRRTSLRRRVAGRPSPMSALVERNRSWMTM